LGGAGGGGGAALIRVFFRPKILFLVLARDSKRFPTPFFHISRKKSCLSVKKTSPLPQKLWHEFEHSLEPRSQNEKKTVQKSATNSWRFAIDRFSQLIKPSREYNIYLYSLNVYILDIYFVWNFMASKISPSLGSR
jgi:hypothetical protein